MASILRRGDSYSVRFKYKDHAGRICEGWESFKTKKEAQDRKISVEKELLDGTFLIPDAMTVAEMLYKWLPIQSSKHKWAPKTYTHTVAMIQNLVVPYLGKKQIQKVQTYDLEQFYATLSRTPRGLYKQGVKQTLTDKQKRQFLTGASIREVHAMLKTAFSYAVEWGLLLKSPTPREAPKINTEERTIWDERTMLAALQTIENPALHLAVHMSMILSLREGEILGLQPSDLDFDAADGRGTISVNKALQRADKVALSKIDPTQIYHTFPDRREGSKSSLILKRTKTKKSNRILYMTKPLKEELLAWLEKMKQDEQSAPEKYSNCGQLFRLPDGLPIAPDVLTKWYRM
jgi:integrase